MAMSRKFFQISVLAANIPKTSGFLLSLSPASKVPYRYHLLLGSRTSLGASFCQTRIASRAFGSMSDSNETGSVANLSTPTDVINFWFGDLERLATDKEYEQKRSGMWWGFMPDAAFNGTQMRSTTLIQKAAKGELKGGDWDTPMGALARLLILDQFPRTAYRGTPEAFSNDEIAAALAMEVVKKGWDAEFTNTMKNFAYVPLMHSERMEPQDKCVELFEGIVEAEPENEKMKNVLGMAMDHRDVISQFGRFPHRNMPLGRKSTPEELEWLSGDDIPMWAKSQMVKEDDS